MSQDTGKFREGLKDQFYTNNTIAQNCITIIKNNCIHFDTFQWVEPSAGNGSFSSLVKDSIAIDIDPKKNDIIMMDFLEWYPETDKQIIIYGNPPFGRQSSLAKAFIKHASKFATTIAFILPRSFTKPSMSNVFPSKFHCIHTSDIPKNAFEINNKSHDVPCIFQIWEKRNIDREKTLKVKEYGFTYVKFSDSYDVAFRRVGGLAGKCYKVNSGVFSPQSHYFLKFDNINVDSIMNKINLHIFPSNTVGPRSLSKSEVNEVINNIII